VIPLVQSVKLARNCRHRLHPESKFNPFASKLVRQACQGVMELTAPRDHEVYQESEEYKVCRDLRVFVENLALKETWECEVFKEKSERKVRLVILALLDQGESLELPALEEKLDRPVKMDRKATEEIPVRLVRWDHLVHVDLLDLQAILLK